MVTQADSPCWEYLVVVRQSQEFMPKLEIPNNASIHTLRSFLARAKPFCDTTSPAILKLHPKWAFMDPMALALTAAWGGWCQRNNLPVDVKDMHSQVNYAARMKLFKHLNVPCHTDIEEHEEAGRFVPLRQVNSISDLNSVLADISALLHLDDQPEGLAAVRYCVSELIRNVLEHAASPEGAYVCAHRYLGKGRKPRSAKQARATTKAMKRVTIAVADCGTGISTHLGRSYPSALTSGREALRLAMQMGVTGAQKHGMYGATENAGAGLFITRAIARATGGYFVLISGDAAFRLNRVALQSNRQLFHNALDDPRSNFYKFRSPWQGTIACVEVATQEIPDFQKFFRWVWDQLPPRTTAGGRIKFTS